MSTERDETPDKSRPQFGYVDDQWEREESTKLLEQTVETLDLHAVIAAVNGMKTEADPRRAVAEFMIAHSIPTGHGDTLVDLLLALGVWIQAHCGV